MPEVKTKTIKKKGIFDIEINSDLIHQVVVSQSSNRRQGNAHTKDRSEKRGGGVKPWRQKGTGRARHGSKRSPIWAGGGVTFGPRKEKNYKKKIPLQMKRKALLMVLSEKKREKTLLFHDLKIKEVKTKAIKDIIDKLNITGSILFVLGQNDKDFVLAQRNIPKTNTITAKDLNAFDLLQHKYVVMQEVAVKAIEDIFLK